MLSCLWPHRQGMITRTNDSSQNSNTDTAPNPNAGCSNYSKTKCDFVSWDRGGNLPRYISCQGIAVTRSVSFAARGTRQTKKPRLARAA